MLVSWIFDSVGSWSRNLEHLKVVDLFAAKDYLCPLKDGLKLAEKECIRCYAFATYRMLDTSRPIARYLIAIMFVGSILLMELLMIRRVFQLFT